MGCPKAVLLIGGERRGSVVVVMRRAAILLSLLLALPVAAWAQSELTLVLGYRAGDASFPVEADATGIACLVPPCVVADAGTPETEVLGLVLDVPIGARWMLEARLDRQEGDLSLATGLPPEAGPVTPESFELTTLQLGALRRWAGDGLSPFLAASIGVARVETSARVLTLPVRPGQAGRRPGSEEGLAVSVGTGVRKALGPRWGLRFEARGLWTDLPPDLGDELVQLEVGLGLSLRL